MVTEFVNEVLQNLPLTKIKNFTIRARAYYLLCTGCKQSFTEFLKKRISTFNFFFYIINVVK